MLNAIIQIEASNSLDKSKPSRQSGEVISRGKARQGSQVSQIQSYRIILDSKAVNVALLHTVPPNRRYCFFATWPMKYELNYWKRTTTEFV